MLTARLRFPVLVSILCALACKKDSKTADSATEDGCVVQNSSGTGTIIEGQYIITYTSGPSADTITTNSVQNRTLSLLARNKISSSAIRASFSGGISGMVANLSRDEVARLKLDGSIKAIEPDRIITLGTCFKVEEPRLITWNINKVGYGDGTGKTAWIIDSGIDTDHPDLNVDKTRSRSFIRNISSFEDENGHGTHVAGIIGAKNNSIGVLGVASGANLVALRVIDKDGEGILSSILQALAYVNSNAKAGDVVNMSVGEEDISAILDEQIQVTAAKGILFAIAAGNDSKAASGFSPARVNGANIFTVTAVDSLNNFARFSNYGNDVVDYAAPGVAILSTWLNGQYARLSGTSMAAPHVAGLLLLNGSSLSSSASAVNDPDGIADPIAHK
jgi:subtilisin